MVTNEFEKFILEISSNKKLKELKITDLKEKVSSLSKSIASRTIKKHRGYELSAETDNLLLLDSFSLEYVYPNQDFLYGGFTINGFTEIFVQKSEFWKFYYDLDPSDDIPDDLKQFEKLNWFEKQPYSDDGRFGCFLRIPGKFPPPIVFFDRGWFTKMELSISEYFDSMIASCAIKGWQYFYINWNQELPYRDEALADLENAVIYLPEIFPDKDFSFHKTKFDEIKSLT